LAFAAASATATAVSFRAGPVYADELKPVPRKEKLSIYPKPDPEIQLVPTESELADHIGVAREFATEKYVEVRGAVQSTLDKWISVEHAVERQVKELIPKDEPMTPGLLYVGVATLTGSVIGRRRSLPIRLLLPPIFFAASLSYFLPKTATNVSDYLSSLETKYAPGVAARHTEINKSISDSYSNAVKTYSKAKVTATDSVLQARRQIEQQTGLKVGDLTPEGSTMQAVKSHAQEMIARAQGEARHLGDQIHDGAKDLKEQATIVLSEEPKPEEKREEPPKRLV